MKPVPWFDPAKRYSAGDLVKFGGAIWRKRPEPGLWDPWTWLPPTVGDAGGG